MADPVIYIIDDDKANNFLTKLMLEDAGLNNLKQFRQAEEALNELKRLNEEKKDDECPALILLDLNMPAMDGWEFLTEFRKLPDDITSKTRIFLLTSSDYPGDIEKAKSFPEITGFLDKPLAEEVAKQLKDKYFSPSFE